MLSYEDIGKELGKNIFIFPLKKENIKGNTIDFTASEIAYTTDGTKPQTDSNGGIIVPAHKAVCILTNETIYITKKLGGTCHSRVGLASRGFGHIGTTLDPDYFGQLLVVLHNTTDKPQTIPKNDRIISIALYYLNSPSHLDVDSWTNAHRDKMPPDVYNDYRKWGQERQIPQDKETIKDKLLSSSEYKAFKKEYSNRLKRHSSVFSLKFFLKKNVIHGLVAIILILAYFVLDFIVFRKQDNPWSLRIDYIVPAVTFFIGTFLTRLGGKDT